MRTTRRTMLAASFGLSAGCLGSVGEREPPACPATVDGDGARIGFVGDVMLGRNVDERWSSGPPAGVWSDTLGRLQALDGLVINLECCISDGGTRRPGRGYYFRAHPDWAIAALDAAGVDVASLANNHLLDFGPEALADTRTHLDAADIAHPGAGPDRSTAMAPAVVDIGDVRVAVVALTDQAPSYAAVRSSPGTAYTSLSVDIERTRRRLGDALERAHDANPDIVVASLHWGPNWETAPSESQRTTARWLIDHGVDVVHGHSAHVIQGIETYRGRPILYDAGDFVDDYVVKPDLHNDRSFLFELVVEDGVLDRLELVPVEIVDERVQSADGEATNWLRDRMKTLSAPFDTPFRESDGNLTVPLDCRS